MVENNEIHFMAQEKRGEVYQINTINRLPDSDFTLMKQLTTDGTIKMYVPSINYKDLSGSMTGTLTQ